MIYESDVPSRFSETVSQVRLYLSDCPSENSRQTKLPSFRKLYYADKGDFSLSVGRCRYRLRQGSLFLYSPSPNRHPVSDSQDFPHLLTFSFLCDSPLTGLLEGQPIQASRAERLLLTQLLFKTASISQTCDSYARRCIAQTSPHSLAAARQTESLLDKLLARHTPSLPFTSLPDREHQYLSVFLYLRNRLESPLSLDKVCKDNCIDRSLLEKLFHEKGWRGVMDCFSSMKINAAKHLIASECMTFSQIATALGYSSVHYFSRQFKCKTKMTPSEYASHIKAHSGDILPLLFNPWQM